MRTFFIIAASALLLAGSIDLLSRIWPTSSLALLLITIIAMIAQGYLSIRLVRTGAATTKPAKSSKPRNRPSRQAAPAGKSSDKSTASGDREPGTVKWFNRTKGFGFIVRESGEEIFVHQRSIQSSGSGEDGRRPTLRDGQAVTFTVANREKGLQAEDVAPA